MSTISVDMASPSRKSGHVKFFNSQKGFGFIIPNDKALFGDAEVFVHHTAICNNGGFKSLAEGEDVEFDMVQGPKGFQASNVTGPRGAVVKGDPSAGRTNTTKTPVGGNNSVLYANTLASNPQLGFAGFGGVQMTGYSMPGQTATYGMPFGQNPQFARPMFPGTFSQSQFPMYTGISNGNFQPQPGTTFSTGGAFATNGLQNRNSFLVPSHQTIGQTTVGQDPLMGLPQTEFDLTQHFPAAVEQQHPQFRWANQPQ